MTYKALCDLDFPRHSSYSSPPITPFFAHPPACRATSLLSAFCTHSSPSQLHPSLPLSSQVTISVGLAWLELQLPPPRLAQHSLCPILTSIFPLAPSDTILLDIFYGGCFVCVSHHTHTQTHNFGMKLQENRNWLTMFMAISPDSRTHSRAQVCGMLDIINEHLAQFSKSLQTVSKSPDVLMEKCRFWGPPQTSWIKICKIEPENFYAPRSTQTFENYWSSPT